MMQLMKQIAKYNDSEKTGTFAVWVFNSCTFHHRNQTTSRDPDFIRSDPSPSLCSLEVQVLFPPVMELLRHRDKAHT